MCDKLSRTRGRLYQAEAWTSLPEDERVQPRHEKNLQKCNLAVTPCKDFLFYRLKYKESVCSSTLPQRWYIALG